MRAVEERRPINEILHIATLAQEASELMIMPIAVSNDTLGATSILYLHQAL